jgi:hypothetical protein
MNLNGIPFIYRYVSIFLDAISRNPRFEPIFDFRFRVMDWRRSVKDYLYWGIRKRLKPFIVFKSGL